MVHLIYTRHLEGVLVECLMIEDEKSEMSIVVILNMVDSTCKSFQVDDSKTSWRAENPWPVASVANE